jgi:hypothetical protein
MNTIIKILTEYIPRKKSVNIEETHAMRNEYICANPEGPVSNVGCSADEPLCKCPAQELIPRTQYIASIYELLIMGDSNFQESVKTEIAGGINKYAVVDGISGGNPDVLDYFPDYTESVAYLRGLTVDYDEPTEDELDNLLDKSKECSRILEVLGEEWLGCVWEDPNSSLSCNCPEVGPRFADYLKYNNTIATFWNTPDYVPLYSAAQRALLSGQSIKISVAGDMSIRPGHIIKLEIDSDNLNPDLESPRRFSINTNRKNSKFTGKWLVSTITHRFTGVKLHKMELTLIRDSIPKSKTEG